MLSAGVLVVRWGSRPDGEVMAVMGMHECQRALVGASVVGGRVWLELPDRGLTCTVRSATRGACGEPAVFSFPAVGSGETFAECAEHHVVPRGGV